MERSEDENEIYFAAYPTKSGSGLRYWGTSRSLVAVRVEGTRSDCVFRPPATTLFFLAR